MFRLLPPISRHKDSKRGHRIQLPLVLLVLFAAGPALCAAIPPSSLPILTTARAAHQLSIAEARRGYPVHLRAVVTFYDASEDSVHPVFFVADSTGSVYLKLKSVPLPAPRPGDLVDVTGISSSGDYAPIVDRVTVRKIGVSSLPANPVKVGMLGLFTNKMDAQWVEVEGVVQSVKESGQRVILNIALRDGNLSAVTVKEPGVDYRHLIDSKIVVRGNQSPLYNGLRQLVGAHIFFPGMSTITVEDPGTPDPFELPADRFDGIMTYSPDSAFDHRIHLRGAVTLFWPGRILCLQNASQSVCAQTGQASPLKTGDLADVIGFPVVGEFAPTLSNASYKPANGQLPLSAAPIAPRQAFSGDFDSRLVEIEGQVQGINRAAVDPTLVLSSGSFIFTAVLPDHAQAAALARVEPGSWVRLTGICSVNDDMVESSAGFYHSAAKSFRILLRSPAGIAIVEKPTWWNAGHTLRVLIVALTFAVLALLTAVILSLRVRRQTSVIRAQLVETARLKDVAEAAHRAADFQASHDALTGVLNRRAIFAALHREFEIATRSGAAVAVIMLDLDHFKLVNDTCGHIAGDQVLRETVKRIQRAVRSTDLVGRYGGEEFLIVLPGCDRDQLQGCAERIRITISGERMTVDGFLLTMTASLGATVAIAGRHSAEDALKASDAALYTAKRDGRNRLIVRDVQPAAGSDPLAPADNNRQPV